MLIVFYGILQYAKQRRISETIEEQAQRLGSKGLHVTLELKLEYVCGENSDPNRPTSEPQSLQSTGRDSTLQLRQETPQSQITEASTTRKTTLYIINPKH